MSKIILISILMVSISLAETPAQIYCNDYKVQSNHYYNMAKRDDYLSKRYSYLYRDFKLKYETCLEEYLNGNQEYKGYKPNPYQQTK